MSTYFLKKLTIPIKKQVVLIFTDMGRFRKNALAEIYLFASMTKLNLQHQSQSNLIV